MKLKVDKSPGLDNLHPRFMEETAETLSEPWRSPIPVRVFVFDLI
jgi:hypothetical protein